MNRLHKLIFAVASAAFFISGSALAQNAGTITNHAVPIGKGPGIQGFTSVAPGTAGLPFVSNGASSDPSFQFLPATGGGTGLTTFAIGDLLQANTTTSLARLAAVATGSVLISGGVGAVSSWGKVGLTTHVTGILPLANGGTASDLSATGGASQFLRQNTSGGAITPVRPACADLSNATAYCSAAVGQLPGETSTGSATAGNVGEVISQTVLIGSAVALTSGTAANVATITLTAGDWDIEAQPAFTGAATTTVTGLRSSISTTSATENVASPFHVSSSYASTTQFVTFDTIFSIARIRVSLSAPQQYWLVSRANFGTSTCGAYGTIRARRVR